MKKYIFFGIAILALVISIITLSAQLKEVTADRDVYKSNTTVLLKDVDRYRTKDSLNAVSVGNLELK